jgi:hypothetical protein
MWHGDKQLRRLQKNDKWLRFRNTHAQSHYPAGLETTRGGLAPSQGARLLEMRAPGRSRIPLTRTLCRVRQRRLADSAPPKGRGKRLPRGCERGMVLERSRAGDAMARGVFELMKATGCLKGCWCGGRWFDRSRNPAGSRRMTGLGMTERGGRGALQSEVGAGHWKNLRLPRQLHRGVCRGSTACGVSSDSAPSDSAHRSADSTGRKGTTARRSFLLGGVWLVCRAVGSP